MELKNDPEHIYSTFLRNVCGDLLYQTASHLYVSPNGQFRGQSHVILVLTPTQFF
jgi:hypothetical protein